MGKKIIGFLKIGSYDASSDMARLQALFYVLAFAVVVLTLNFIFRIVGRIIY